MNSVIDPGLRLDLQRAHSVLIEAELSASPAARFLAAHRTALRLAAIVLALKSARSRLRSGGRRKNVWQMLAEVAPEFAEWAAFFAATQPKHDVISAGATRAVSAREADDLIRDVTAFLRLVERALVKCESGGCAEK